MKLYHFTAKRYVESILKHGIVSVGEKMRRDDLPKTIPQGGLPPEQFEGENELVWLTRDPDPPSSSLFWNREVRIEVEIDKIERWERVADRLGVPSFWRKILSENCGGKNSRDWYVTMEAIPPGAIVAHELVTQPDEFLS